jgi:hypothetical protein
MKVIEGSFGKQNRTPDTELITTLKQMLEKAEAGVITDMVAVTFENEEGDVNSYWSASGYHALVMTTMLQQVAIERLRK